MAVAVLMPRQGNTVETCRILSWKKEPGAAVREGDVLCEVETDKAAFEVPAPADGTLLERFFEEGADVPVLTNIAAIGAPGDAYDDLRPVAGAAPAPPPAPAEGGAPELIGLWHTVRSGETVSLLAGRFGVPIEDVIELNGLVDPSRIEVNQRLFIYGVEEIIRRNRRPAGW